RVSVWDLATGKEATAWEEAGRVSGLANSPDGTRIAGVVGDADRRIKVWEAGTGRELHVLRPFPPEEPSQDDDSPPRLPRRTVNLSFSADGSRLAVQQPQAVPDGGPTEFEVTVWDAKSGKRISSAGLVGYRVRGSASFNPDGKTFLGADGNILRCWDAATG